MAKKSKDKKDEKKSGKKAGKEPGPVAAEVPPMAESAPLAREKAKAPKKPIGTKPASKADKPASAIFQTPPAPAASAAKPAPAKRASKPAKAPVISEADISLRAYFLAEKRRNAMLPGDERQDWIEAERQLREESGAPAMRARTSGKL